MMPGMMMGSNAYRNMLGSAAQGGDQGQYNQMFQPPQQPQMGQMGAPPSMAQRLGMGLGNFVNNRMGQQQNGQNPFLQALAAHYQRQRMGGMGGPPPTGMPNRPMPWAMPNPMPQNTAMGGGAANMPQGPSPQPMPFRPQGQQMFGPPGSQQ